MPSDPNDNISVMVSFDDSFVIPSATLIGSILNHISPGRGITFYLLYHGTRRNVIQRFEALLSRPDANCVWLHHNDAERAILREIYLEAHTHYPPANYSRLLISELLPPDVDKVIYLDGDTLVRKDIDAVWQKEMGENVMLAAADPLIRIDAPMAQCGISPAPGKEDLGALQYKAYLSRIVREAEGDYGFSEDDTYFQAGVLVINLAAMRRGGLTQELVKFMGSNPNLSYPDQDAINIVLRGRIGELDEAWNVTGTVFHQHATGDLSGASPQISTLVSDPALVHFTLRPKPWQYGCAHPFLGEWHEAIDSTPWRSYRATRMNHLLQKIPKARRLISKKISQLLPS